MSLHKLHQPGLEDSSALLDSLCEVVHGLYPNITRMQYSIDESTLKIVVTIFSVRPLKIQNEIAIYLFSDAAEEKLGIYGISNINFAIEEGDTACISSKRHKHFHHQKIDAFCEKVQSRFKPSIQSVVYRILSPDKKKIALIISGNFSLEEQQDIREYIIRTSPLESMYSISDVLFLKWGHTPDVPNGLSREFLQNIQRRIQDIVAYILQFCRDTK